MWGQDQARNMLMMEIKAAERVWERFTSETSADVILTLHTVKNHQLAEDMHVFDCRFDKPIFIPNVTVKQHMTGYTQTTVLNTMKYTEKHDRKWVCLGIRVLNSPQIVFCKVSGDQSAIGCQAGEEALALEARSASSEK